MKKFVIKSAMFLVPVILFIAAWEYGLNSMQNSYELKRSQLEAQAPKIQVLVLGGSFSLRGVDPEYFSMRGYNLANVQQSIFFDTRITLKYLDRMKSLKVVLIAVSYNSLWWQINDFREYFYADYWGIRYPGIKWYDLALYSKIMQYGNQQAWAFARRGFKVNLVAGYDDNGFAVKRGKAARINDSAGYELVHRFDENSKQVYLDSNINDLKTFLNALNSRGIIPVFYTPPVPQFLSKFYNKNKVKTMDSVMAMLCGAYHCKWFDYRDDSRFSISDFKNVSHLNEDGAAKFSKIINEEILQKYCSAELTKNN